MFYTWMFYARKRYLQENRLLNTGPMTQTLKWNIINRERWTQYWESEAINLNVVYVTNIM